MESITADELKERLNKGEALHIVDVREEWEYEEFNIGGKLIPMATLPARIEELSDIKNEEIIVYCRSGSRSARAIQFLVSNGFTKVKNLTGGMMEWQKKFPV